MRTKVNKWGYGMGMILFKEAKDLVGKDVEVLLLKDFEELKNKADKFDELPGKQEQNSKEFDIVKESVSIASPISRTDLDRQKDVSVKNPNPLIGESKKSEDEKIPDVIIEKIEEIVNSHIFIHEKNYH